MSKQYTNIELQGGATITGVPTAVDNGDVVSKGQLDLAVAGASGVVWKGAWDSSVAYVPNDGVEEDGSSYIAVSGGTDQLPSSSPDYWNLMAQSGYDGIDGDSPTITVGTVTTGAPGTDVEITNTGTSVEAVFDFIIPRGDTGAVVARSTANVTTPSIADSDNWTGTIELAVGYRLLRVETDVPARVRLYGRADKQASDVGRALGVDPVGNHGLAFEFVTTSSVLDAYCTPPAEGASFEDTLSADIPITVTNRSGSAGTITVTLTFAITE
jgi:hypothetical protein